MKERELLEREKEFANNTEYINNSRLIVENENEGENENEEIVEKNDAIVSL